LLGQSALKDILPLKGKRTVTRSPRGMQQRRKKEYCMRGRKRSVIKCIIG
jgi:hypothetical protein